MAGVRYADFEESVRVLGFGSYKVIVETGEGVIQVSGGLIDSAAKVLNPDEARALRKALKRAIKVAEANCDG